MVFHATAPPALPLNGYGSGEKSGMSLLGFTMTSALAYSLPPKWWSVTNTLIPYSLA